MTTNAIDLLTEDHNKVKKLLEDLTNTTTRAAKTRPKLLAEIERELKIHIQIEDEIFYPAFKAKDGAEHDKMYHEATEEHRAVEKLVLPDLKKADPTSAKFSGRAKVLKELVEHHVDEEEKEMFKRAKQTMSKDELNELGERMNERKKQLLAQYKS